jgi:hypothetical protein
MTAGLSNKCASLCIVCLAPEEWPHGHPRAVPLPQSSSGSVVGAPAGCIKPGRHLALTPGESARAQATWYSFICSG